MKKYFKNLGLSLFGAVFCLLIIPFFAAMLVFLSVACIVSGLLGHSIIKHKTKIKDRI